MSTEEKQAQLTADHVLQIAELARAGYEFLGPGDAKKELNAAQQSSQQRPEGLLAANDAQPQLLLQSLDPTMRTLSDAVLVEALAEPEGAKPPQAGASAQPVSRRQRTASQSLHVVAASPAVRKQLTTWEDPRDPQYLQAMREHKAMIEEVRSTVSTASSPPSSLCHVSDAFPLLPFSGSPSCSGNLSCGIS